MSAARNYFGPRDRPSFRGKRPFNKYVPISRHSIFIRQLPATISPKAVRNFFEDETNTNVEIDFVSYTDDRKKLCVAIRFESHFVAKDMIERFNNREILGHIVDVTWYKDLKSIKDYRFSDARRGRYPRRGGGRYRSVRSGSRGYRRRESSRDNKYRSRSRDSGSSSSSSKSRSGSESDSPRSSGSPTRLIRDINKEKYKRRRSSRESFGSRGPSRDLSHGRNIQEGEEPPRKWRRSPSEHEGDSRNIRSRRSWDRSPRRGSSATGPHPVVGGRYKRPMPPLPSERPEPDTIYRHENPENIPEPAGPPPASSLVSSLRHADEGASQLVRVKFKSEQLLENYHQDIEQYLNFVNLFVAKNADLESELVNSLNSVLTERGESYVTQFISFIDELPKEVEV